jgi:hypothetical protein
LIDNHCQPATIVANYTAAPPLGSNVDAAIAQLIPGQMDQLALLKALGPLAAPSQRRQSG